MHERLPALNALREAMSASYLEMDSLRQTLSRPGLGPLTAAQVQELNRGQAAVFEALNFALARTIRFLDEIAAEWAADPSDISQETITEEPGGNCGRDPGGADGLTEPGAGDCLPSV